MYNTMGCARVSASVGLRVQMGANVKTKINLAIAPMRCGAPRFPTVLDLLQPRGVDACEGTIQSGRPHLRHDPIVRRFRSRQGRSNARASHEYGTCVMD